MSQPQHALPSSVSTQPRAIVHQRNTGRHARRRLRPGHGQDLAAAVVLVVLAMGAMYVAAHEFLAGHWLSLTTSGLAVAGLYASAVVLLIRVTDPDQEDS